MQQDNSHKNRTFFLGTAAALIVGIVVVAGLVYWHGRGAVNPDQADTGSRAKLPVTQVTQVTPATGGILGNMNEEQIVEAQKVAASAAIMAKPLTGKITERPGFVSEVEWNVFQNICKGQPDKGDELLNVLVNKLLFFKKQEAWRLSGESTAQRKELAKQLLEMVPEQLKIRSIDEKTAKEMEMQLKADLGKTR